MRLCLIEVKGKSGLIEDNLPVVTRFLCPPETPLNISFPTIISAQTSSPKICRHMIKGVNIFKNIISWDAECF